MNESAQPLVSVCIPTYNRSARLLRAVEHLLAGTYSHLEIIISDNASTDDTHARCTELSQRHPNVRYFRHPTNQGPTANFRFARLMAKGKYFLWHGDDDYLAGDFIAKCVDELEADPGLVLVSGLGAYHKGDHAVTHHGNLIRPSHDSGLLRALYFISTVQEGSIFSGLYRREAVAGCEMPNCLAGDHVWLAEVLLQGKAKVVPDTFVYREEWDNTSKSMGSIVHLLGLPGWNACFPWLAIPYNLAWNIAYHSPKYRFANPMKKAAVFVSVYAVSFARQWIYAAIIRISRAKRSLRRLFRPHASRA
jgi:glycosyltransferase involved in cell wall biosynthesis